VLDDLCKQAPEGACERQEEEKNRDVLVKGGKTETCETEQGEMWKKTPKKSYFLQRTVVLQYVQFLRAKPS